MLFESFFLCRLFLLDGYLGYIQFLTIVNNAATYMEVHLGVQIYVFVFIGLITRRGDN